MDFDSKTAAKLAEMSLLSYAPEKRVRAELKKQKYNCTFFSKKGTQAFIAESKDHVIVCFRGTEKNFADILADIKIFKRKTLDGKMLVHRGFFEALNHVWFGPKGMLNKLATIKKPIFYCGHSLGGALATLAHIRHRGKALYTYGSPRVVNRTIPTNNCFRIVNCIDIVARVPPFFMRYRHVGQLYYLTRNGKLYVKKYQWLNIELLEEIFGFLSIGLSNTIAKKIVPRLFTDHRIGEYIGKLKAVTN